MVALNSNAAATLVQAVSGGFAGKAGAARSHAQAARGGTQHLRLSHRRNGSNDPLAQIFSWAGQAQLGSLGACGWGGDILAKCLAPAAAPHPDGVPQQFNQLCQLTTRRNKR
jgi:hypothetical protein